MPALDRVRVLEAPRAIADAEFTDQEGAPFEARRPARQGRVRAVRLHELPGRVPVGDGAAARSCTMRRRSTRPTSRTSMISVDGERDTPAAMKEFLAHYSREFIGFTAPPARVKPIAEQFSAAFFKGAHRSPTAPTTSRTRRRSSCSTRRQSARGAVRRVARGDDGRRSRAAHGTVTVHRQRGIAPRRRAGPAPWRIVDQPPETTTHRARPASRFDETCAHRCCAGNAFARCPCVRLASVGFRSRPRFGWDQ